MSGFTDVNLNVDGAVLDAAMAALFIHLEEVATAVANEQGTSGFTSHYVYRFREALEATNTTLGAHLTLDSCIK
ncbi:hypothetical protein GN958_ATG04924 [Phytophthora infestans]|uniref:Uncharacterized protein n=1 Tax=Phytophthora infestans TaxID=4787 RepID=A0A8S9V306_PHYIN|nr:hypothetical protein GN958_ATG04924 [Phytophthora infestans]